VLGARGANARRGEVKPLRPALVAIGIDTLRPRIVLSKNFGRLRCHRIIGQGKALSGIMLPAA
jgi:hypothetical protein